MAKARAGWERIIYYGTAGSTAATQLTHATDVDVNKPKERTDTTDRGDGSAIPRGTQQVVQRNAEITFKYRYYDSDAVGAALIAVAESGADIAIKVERYSGGPTEFDGDVTLDLNSPGPLTGGMELEFTATPSQDSGRNWSDT